MKVVFIFKTTDSVTEIFGRTILFRTVLLWIVRSKQNWMQMDGKRYACIIILSITVSSPLLCRKKEIKEVKRYSVGGCLLVVLLYTSFHSPHKIQANKLNWLNIVFNALNWYCDIIILAYILNSCLVWVAEMKSSLLFYCCSTPSQTKSPPHNSMQNQTIHGDTAS